MGVSAVLAVLLATVAHVGFNAANLGTIFAGAFGGALAFFRPDTRLVVGLGCVFVIAGMVPALIGGVGLLYFPSVVCLGVSAAMGRHARWAGHGQVLYPT